MNWLKIACILLPLLGAAYGACLGAYLHSKNRTPWKKKALIFAGALIVLSLIALLIVVFGNK